ncbi:hypothetical protein B0T10DRAFT_473534 [Thelonectria olida]|uniref:Uncharacterized protein n=1 Tax=Thelonectria olida TaxID=1576542 RepID=A0A9P9AYG1_9HYPO|nr:hypothetical protein B0T10DRAFT_473534 [Thelonectria olida]
MQSKSRLRLQITSLIHLHSPSQPPPGHSVVPSNIIPDVFHNFHFLLHASTLTSNCNISSSVSFIKRRSAATRAEKHLQDLFAKPSTVHWQLALIPSALINPRSGPPALGSFVSLPVAAAMKHVAKERHSDLPCIFILIPHMRTHIRIHSYAKAVHKTRALAPVSRVRPNSFHPTPPPRQAISAALDSQRVSPFSHLLAYCR